MLLTVLEGFEITLLPPSLGKLKIPPKARERGLRGLVLGSEEPSAADTVLTKKRESMSELFFILAILSAVWGVVSSIVLASFLSNRGIKINWLFFRILMLKYIHHYHRITTQENGKPGSWFYSYIISMNLALVLAIVGIVLK